MKLKAVQVSDYKSVRQSNRFEVSDITCLVGKNESGKTSLLEALYRLNPIIEKDAQFDVTEDYPRADVEDYRQDVESHNRKPAIVVRAEFTLEEADTSELFARFGRDLLASPVLTLSKGYDNKLHYH